MAGVFNLALGETAEESTEVNEWAKAGGLSAPKFPKCRNLSELSFSSVIQHISP